MCRLRSSSLLLDFRGALERLERVVPEAIEIGAEGLDPSGVQFVEASVAGGTTDDQARVLQDPQMLRDRRRADRKIARELAARQRAVQQPLEDCPACGVAKRVELFGMLVSN